MLKRWRYSGRPQIEEKIKKVSKIENSRLLKGGYFLCKYFGILVLRYTFNGYNIDTVADFLQNNGKIF